MSINLSNTDPDVIAQFSRMNSSFFLVNNQKNQLFIDKDLKYTKKETDKISNVEVLGGVITFLSLKILKTEKIPPKALLLTFKDNIRAFSKEDCDEGSIEIQKRAREIESILENMESYFALKLKKILNTEASSLTKDEVNFLHRTLSFLVIEYQILDQCVNTFSISVQSGQLQLEVLEKGICFTPFSADDPLSELNFSLPLEELLKRRPENAATYHEMIQKMCKFLDPKREKNGSLEYSNFIQSLIDYKQKGPPEAAFSDACLAALKFHEFRLIQSKILTGYGDYFKALRQIFEKRPPLFHPSLEELHPHLIQIMHLTIPYSQAMNTAKQEVVSRFPKNAAYGTGVIAPLFFCSLFKAECEMNSDYFDKIQSILKDYQKSFHEKYAIYHNIYNKLLDYRNSVNKKTEYLYLFKHHESLLEQTQDSKHLPHPHVFKEWEIVLPKPVAFKEDDILTKSHPFPFESLKLPAVVTRPPTKGRRKRKTAALSKIPYFECNKMPEDVVMKIFSYLTRGDLACLGATGRHFRFWTNRFLNSLMYEEEQKPLSPRNEIEHIEKNPLSFCSDIHESFPWLTQMQSLVENSESVTERINASPLGATLKNPIKHFADYFNRPLSSENEKEESSIFEKMVGWIVFADHLFSLDALEVQIDIVRALQLGSILSTCARILNSLPPSAHAHEISLEMSNQIRQMSFKLIKVMTESYFLQGETGVECPQASSHQMPQAAAMEQLLDIMLEEDGRTIVTAWDSAQNRFLFSKSGRMFAMNPNRIPYWKRIEKKCISSLKKNSVSCTFAQQTIDKTLVNLLLNAAIPFHQSLVPSKSHRHITDRSFIRGRFTKYLTRLGNDRQNITDRKGLYKNLHDTFEEMLSEEKWEKLSRLFEVGNLTETSESVGGIIFRGSCTPRQALIMTIAELTCGEVKIVLECCREAGKLSQEERLRLPVTLKERLQFSAIHSSERTPNSVLNNALTNRLQAKGKIKTHKVDYLNFCSKCTDLWPVFEALYRVILESGLDISAIVALQQSK